MSGFSDLEESIDDAQPVELYEFNLLGTQYLYTNAEQEITVGIDTFLPAAGIGRTRIVSTIEAKDGQVDISLPGDNAFSRLFIGILPGELPEITIKQLHTNDPGSETIFIFQGEVATVGFQDDFSSSTVACKPITSANDRFMLRHTFQGLCNHMHYDERCGVIEGSFRETVAVDTVDDRLITISAGALSTEVAGYWEAGFIQFGNEYRTINAASGAVMTIDIPFLVNPQGSNVVMLPGCNLVIDEDCDLVYSNSINHGGYPYVPTKNPFDRLD